MKKFIKENWKYILSILIFIILMIPIILISKYNHPSADDYNYSITTYNILKSGGNIFDLIKGAFDTVFNFRKVWHGAYTSVFIMSFQPGIFGEKYYFFSSMFLIGIFILSTIYLVKTIMSDILRQKKQDYVPICILLLIIQIEFLPSAVQGFFWWNGAINYTFFYSLSLILFASVIKYINGKENISHIIIMFILSFLIGGGNYSTPLVTIIVLVLTSLYQLYKSKNKDKKWLVILSSALLIGIGLIISIKCPGTLIRQQQENSVGLGVINSILVSLKLMVGYFMKWTRPYMILLFILSCILIYPIVKRTNIKAKFPLVFTILTYGITAAHFTAPLYALGYSGDGRLTNLAYFYYCIVTILNIFYYMCYFKNIISKKCDEKKIKFEVLENILEELFGKYKVYLICLFIPIFILLLRPHLDSMTTYTATKSLKTDEAVEYDSEINTRINLYLDDNIKDVEVLELTVKPKLLFFSDITEDKDYWSNISVRDYYNKNSVKLK